MVVVVVCTAAQWSAVQMHPSVKNRKQQLADNKQMLQSNINMESKQPQSATTVPVLKSNKYQLLELNPCDAWPHAHHALQTELDAQCDKMIFDLRQYGQLSLTDDGPVYHTNRPTMIRTSWCDDLHAVAKFSKSRLWGKVQDGSVPIFGNTRVS